ncbi:MAG: peptidylprolyl isomerase [Gemmatimonadota bacterium]|nr:peptidylprolyl isomerase [Gemmatimonadota bacterium]
MRSKPRVGPGRAASRYGPIALCLVGFAACSAEDAPETDEYAGPRAGAEEFRVRIQTSKGVFVIDVHPEWAPLGSGQFRNLVTSGYYDDARFHRVVPDFIVQWGLAGDPRTTAGRILTTIPDDPVVASNTRGRVAFAFTEPGTRSTQVFISLVDNSRLDEQGFAPFGEVVEGMDVVVALYSGYGEESGGGLRRGDQRRIVAEGNAYLDAEFPLLDRLISATVERNQ